LPTLGELGISGERRSNGGASVKANDPRLKMMVKMSAIAKKAIRSADDFDRTAAKILSGHLPSSATLIQGMAERNRKGFFIYLGKCLSGELDSECWDKLDCAIVGIVSASPRIKSPEAVRELRKRGWNIDESAFRMRKMRLGLNALMQIYGKQAAVTKK
jgi:hypothetical protein